MEGKSKFVSKVFSSIEKGNTEIKHSWDNWIVDWNTNRPGFTEFITKYQFKRHTSKMVMLRDVSNIEVSVICSPNYMHAVQSSMTLNMGLPVILKKIIERRHQDFPLWNYGLKNLVKLLQVIQNNLNGLKISLIFSNGILCKVLSVESKLFLGKNNDNKLWKGNQALYEN